MTRLPVCSSVWMRRMFNRLAGRSHSWARQGSLIRLRSRRWFFDRPKEVPLRLIRHWVDLCGQYGVLPLEAYLEVATSLNDGQVSTLGDLVAEGVLPYE